jgi:hypothetical protein
MEILYIIGGVAIGLFFCITPIPYLHMLYIHGVKEQIKNKESIVWVIVFSIINLPWALTPIALILGTISHNPFVGIPMGVAMYFPLWSNFRNKNVDESKREK